MPQVIAPAKKAKIKSLYASGSSIAALAKQFDVDRKSIGRWVADEAWERDRQPNVIAQSIIQEEAPGEPEELPASLEIIEDTIAALRRQLAAGVSGRDAASIGNALERLVRRRDEMKPQTVSGLVDYVIQALAQWELGPRDFVVELRDRQKSG